MVLRLRLGEIEFANAALEVVVPVYLTRTQSKEKRI